jgi:hypothetical protein
MPGEKNGRLKVVALAGSGVIAAAVMSTLALLGYTTEWRQTVNDRQMKVEMRLEANDAGFLRIEKREDKLSDAVEKLTQATVDLKLAYQDVSKDLENHRRATERAKANQ